MNYINVVHRNGSKVIVSNFEDVVESSTYLKNLRLQNDHTPFISLVNRGEEIPQNIRNNCCGGHLHRDELGKLEEMIEVLSIRNHNIHC